MSLLLKRAPGGAVWIAIFFIVFVILLLPKISQVRQLKERSDSLSEELKKLQSQNKALETELRLLREDPVYLEKVARQKFNKAKEGEIVYRVVREGEVAR